MVGTVVGLAAGGCDGSVCSRSTPRLWSSVRDEGVMSDAAMGVRDRSMILASGQVSMCSNVDEFRSGAAKKTELS